MLEVEGLSKKYGKLTAVDELSFKVDEGAIFGFIGPNGAGKTTTFKILATLLRPSSGKAWIEGEEVISDPRRIRQLVGYMPDFFGVYDDLKVDEYLDFYGASYGIPFARRKKTIDELLELVDLNHKREAYVDSLSRGMKQRLCLTRCLIHDPRLLILDEPASGLDPRSRLEVRGILKELKSMGKTIIVSSHILSEMAEICTHMGIIEAGQMVVSGTVEEIMQRTREGRFLEIKVMEKKAEAEALLRNEMGLTVLNTYEKILEISFAGDEQEMNRILTALMQAGIPVVSFSLSGGKLEDVFMQITKGVVQE